MHIRIEGRKGIALAPFPALFLAAAAEFTGSKKWVKSGEFHFVADAFNVRLLKNKFPTATWEDKTGTLSGIEQLDKFSHHQPYQHPDARVDSLIPPKLWPRPPTEKPPRLESGFHPVLDPWAHQRETFDLAAERPAYALLWEMGTGKSAWFIWNFGHLWIDNEVTGVLITAPKGVHNQWIDEQIPEHWPKELPRPRMIAWNGKDLKPIELAHKLGELVVFTINIDAIRVDVDRNGNLKSTSRGFDNARKFLEAHGRKTMMGVDESQDIKGYNSQRTAGAIALGRFASFRRIMTGTPIGKNLVDAFPQFYFLNPDILGHRYMTAFRSHFCILGGVTGYEVVGHKNVEEFWSLIAPHSSRVTKKEALDLPEQLYVRKVFELSSEQRAAYQTAKEELIVHLTDGDIDVNGTFDQLIKLQQIVCGFIKKEDGALHHFPSNPRLDLWRTVAESVSRPIITWSRFTENVEAVAMAAEKIGMRSALYYGGQSERANRAAKEDWLAGKLDHLSANPQSGGVGLNLQGDCENNIYFANSFRWLDRVQSESRTHRAGMRGGWTAFDLMARRSIDTMIINNLRSKRDLSELSLDTIRLALLAE